MAINEHLQAAHVTISLSFSHVAKRTVYALVKTRDLVAVDANHIGCKVCFHTATSASRWYHTRGIQGMYLMHFLLNGS